MPLISLYPEQPPWVCPRVINLLKPIKTNVSNLKTILILILIIITITTIIITTAKTTTATTTQKVHSSNDDQENYNNRDRSSRSVSFVSSIHSSLNKDNNRPSSRYSKSKGKMPSSSSSRPSSSHASSSKPKATSSSSKKKQTIKFDKDNVSTTAKIGLWMMGTSVKKMDKAQKAEKKKRDAEQEARGKK
ncbi:hypothetical protein QBC44DRAFT_363583 [Cladorrhinum sp. PSN332]|nr:hypothetical protein QBC44DRAFT_363583 [Cladorrhinum sp. PSN332]